MNRLYKIQIYMQPVNRYKPILQDLQYNKSKF